MESLKLLAFYDKLSAILLVLKGRVMAYAVSEDGKELLLLCLKKGECTPIASGAMPKPDGFDIVWLAEEDSSAVIIPGYVFRDIFENNRKVQEAVYNIMLHLSSRAMQKMGNVIFVGVKVRLARYLYESYSLYGREFFVTKENIAKEIGSAREVVTRILSALEREGIVKTARGKITICNKEKLERLI